MKTVSLINGSTNNFITHTKITNIGKIKDMLNPQGIPVVNSNNKFYFLIVWSNKTWHRLLPNQCDMYDGVTEDCWSTAEK
jgi:hypothetical protein